MITGFIISIFSIFLEIAPVLPEVFENIFLSRYLTEPYPTRSKNLTCFKGLRLISWALAYSRIVAYSKNLTCFKGLRLKYDYLYTALFQFC